MSLFVVDPAKCKRDKICVEVCPLGLIELSSETSGPSPIEGAEDLCVSCGHCVSACPAGALSHRAMTPAQCTPIRPELSVTPEQTEELLRARRSIRVYRSVAADKETLARVVAAASYAPSGHNTQPTEWLVIHDNSVVRRIAASVVDWMRLMIREKPDFAKTILLDHVVANWEKGIDAVCRSAPHIVIAHARKDDMMAPSACTIALAHLELAARTHGLGTCWAGYVHVAAMYFPPLQKELGLPDGHVSYGAMMLGYPKYKYYRVPVRKETRITWK
jgi:nitroreductase/NAD-dependent dihydropyrimidine dehydrogenase PreA subunit